ncbi:sulfite exporter TauE/SafE family protein [Chengkuizengella axinellae]|uniref:Probable membrane transporter protein n=1 Tax=Chengkuizengella axinellae TaxID=3064388 RepID=A0ABT9J050_9BACL|nr:sulfite exporter TauE/SafE family protein [Chengkuizengella sp. 2205SS18-9]MDP5274999.1 sulfite exporter TauE/SafE family protein [Chengkuizengella sp. 2205SS18-9]
MISFLIILCIGIVSAVFGSLVGLGGGVFIVPALIYLTPLLLEQEMSSSVAVGTSLTVLIFTAASSTFTFFKQGRVDFKSGLLFFVTSGPAAMLGASLTSSFQGNSFQLAFGIFIFLMALLLIVKKYIKPLSIQWKIQKSYVDPTGENFTYGYNILPALAVGFAVGLVSGLFGIGGGSLFVPVMVLLFSFPPHVATATSMFVILLSSIIGSATHIYLGEIHWFSLMALAPGALFGGWLGAWIAGRLSSKILLNLLLVILFLISLRLIIEGIA